MILLSLVATLFVPVIFAQIPFSVPEIPTDRGFLLPGKATKEAAGKVSTNSEEERTSGRRLGELIHDVSKELYLTINNPYYYGRRPSTQAYPTGAFPQQISPYSLGLLHNQLPQLQPLAAYPFPQEAFSPMSQQLPIEAYLAAQQSFRNQWNSPYQPNFGMFPY